MVSRSRHDPERMARIIESARKARVADGLPADDPADLEYEANQAAKKAKRAQKRKGKT